MRYDPKAWDELRAYLTRGTLEKTDDSKTQQFVELRGLRDERFTEVHRPQPFGLSAHAPAKSEGLLLNLGGRRDRVLALGFEHKDHRPRDLPEGATKLYDASGNVVSLVEKKVRVVGASMVSVGVSGGRWVVVRPDRVDIGVTSPEGQTNCAVVTSCGTSTVVFAEVM